MEMFVVELVPRSLYKYCAALITTARDDQLSTPPTMSWTAYSSQLSARSFEPTAADRALKATQQKKSIKELWLLITAVIGFLFVIRILRLIVTSLFSRYTLSTSEAAASTEKSYPEAEAVSPGGTGKASWRRLPAALASAFRVVAFRIQVPIGLGAASFAELFFICAYIATMLSLTLTNCKSLRSFSAPLCSLEPSALAEKLDYWFFEDRAAHLASCQLPFIIALAGKNNIISCEQPCFSTRKSN